jgi:hypothetical protein
VLGRSDKIREALRAEDLLSVRELAEVCRQGGAKLAERFGITIAQAEALAASGEETIMLIEEVDLRVTTDLELNLGSQEQPTWRNLDHLSTGQKATALLLLLLQGGDAPLVIDQPEDDLDNRFIFEGIVPKVRTAKSGRQLIFSTHNANIPVLGDADLIAALKAQDRGGSVSGELDAQGLGSIDNDPVRALVEELLEGGREAFLMRRYLYGF